MDIVETCTKYESLRERELEFIQGVYILAELYLVYMYVHVCLVIGSRSVLVKCGYISLSFL